MSAHIVNTEAFKTRHTVGSVLMSTCCIAVSIAEALAIAMQLKTQFSKLFAVGDKWASNPLIVLS